MSRSTSRTIPERGGSRGFLLAIAAAAASGILCGLAFPLEAWRGLAWVGLVPLLLALRRGGPGRAALLGAVYSLALWAVVWDWGPAAITHYFLQPPWVGWLFFFGLALGTVAPPTVAFAWIYRYLAARRARALPLLAGAAWAACELLRGRLVHVPFPVGNPWAILGYSQVGVLPVVQIASVTGVYGISFALVAVNAALTDALLAAWQGRRRLADLAVPLALGALPVAIVLAYGLFALRAARADRGGGRPVAIVQPNRDVAAHWKPSAYAGDLSASLALTDRAVSGRAVDTVFWPEAAMAFFPDDEPGYRRAIASELVRRGVELVAGAPRRTEGGVLNSIYVLEPDGTLRARYDKRLLIPFAEYAPLDGFRLLRRSFGGVRAFVAGRPRPPLPTRVGAAGVLICNESMFAEVARQRVAEGATYLVNAANDGWIRDPEYAVQQFEVAVMRAVEERRDMVRVSTSGPSAIVDATGRVRAETRPFTEATLVGTVRPRSTLTVYGRVGDLFAVLCAALTLAALAAGDRSRGGDAAR